MSYFKQCEECGKEINSYDSTLCKNCLEKHDEHEKYDSLLKEKDAYQLEDMWQAQYITIKMALEKYYECGDEKYRDMAQQAQKKQSKIQDYITLRSRA